MSDTRRSHKDGCSCEACVYDRARLRLPIASVRRIPDYRRPGLTLAMDQIAETVAAYWREPDEERATDGVMECDHWHARRMVVCPDCGEDWEE